MNEIQKIVENYGFMKDTNIVNIELATTNPDEIIALFRTKKSSTQGIEKTVPQPLKHRLLFLEINFDSNFEYHNGIKLAAEIREYDIWVQIVFVTNQEKPSSDIMEHYISALGHVYKKLPKQQLKEKIIDFVDESRKRMTRPIVTRRSAVEFQVESRKQLISLADIYYIKGCDFKDQSKYEHEFERLSSTVLHKATKPERLYLKKRLKFYESEIPELVRVGKSYLINPLNVYETELHGKHARITLTNGEILIVTRNALYKYEQLLSKKQTKGLL